MSRTFHPRRPRDDGDRTAPRYPNEKKRALFSFKRIGGILVAGKPHVDCDCMSCLPHTY